MYHSITFKNKNGDKNIWDDWHLIPSSRPVFNPPKPKTTYVDIPGANGSLDLSEVVSGEVVYEPRTGSFELIVANGYQDWHVLYSEILNYLHGQNTKAILEDDPDYYYEGRFAVNQWKSDPYYSVITIDYTVYPYKLEHASSVGGWAWDDFNFETGIVRDYKDIRVDGTHTLVVVGSEMSVVPVFTVSSDDGSGLTVEYEGTKYTLNDGNNRIIHAKIHAGNNTFIFTGNGTFSLEYRGGSL